MKKAFGSAFMVASAFAFASWMSGTATTEARSTYYTSNGCQGCHGTTSTCNGCHSHGTHSSSGKTDVNVKGQTGKTTYAPGETVSVTVSGGYKTGWIRAVLYDQNMNQVAISKGTIQAGSSAPSGGAGYPVTLSAPAPATAGTYTWNVSWYGNKYDATGAFFQTACSSTVTSNCWKASTTNPNHGEAIVKTNSFTVSGTGTCSRSAPTVTFNPTSKTLAAGTSTTYTATITNKDTAACSSSSFTLSIPSETGTIANFILPSTLSTTSCSSLAPGASCTSTLTVKAQTAATNGATNTTTVRATDATNHGSLLGSGTVTSTIGAAPKPEACQDGIDNDGDGLIDCADPDCSADTSCSTAKNSAHAGINSYAGPTTCIACHSTAGTEVLASMHGSWSGPTPNVTNITGNSGKWRQTNNYCTDPELADFGCVKCHVTIAAKVLNKDGMVDLSTKNLSANEMDCLQCHSAAYRATFMPDPATATNHTSCVDGSVRSYMIPTPGADGKIHKQMRLDLSPGETALSLARKVSRPVSSACLKCHAGAGGSDGAKRGDISSAMASPAMTVDVHLSPSGNAKLNCSSCHVATKHQIPGRGNDMRGEDTGAIMKKCTDCHPQMATGTGHGTSTTNRIAADRHIAHVDCTACHIDYYGKGVSTEMSRDWTKPWWNTAGCEGQGAWAAAEVRGSNVLPEYRFWNKLSTVYDRNGRVGLTTDPIDGGLTMAMPQGGISDGKLYPFKVHTAINPFDDGSGKTNFNVLSMFMDGCFDKAAVSGLSFIGESGTYTWKENKTFQLITHGVAPKTEGDNCAKCHDGIIDTSKVSKLDKLGYKTVKPTSDLCDDCHAMRTETNFFNLHSYHSSRTCSSCHSFSR